MKKFQFKLEQIFKVRKHIEKKAQTDFAIVYADFKKHEDSIVAASEKRKAQFHLSNEWIANGDIDLLRRREFTFQSLRIISEENLKDIEMKKPLLEQSREKLLKASVNRKAMEKLKEKAWANYIQEYEKNERIEMDEYGVNSYMRKKKEEEYQLENNR